MKLHCIRVTNLNSLYGEQQLDLDADLQGASLFLIQGPTGSGKSTLMDAVSLALFGTTPRLDGFRSERDVAEQVMSRGTGLAIAQLEFSKWSSSGEGRVRYRATWKARRAREKPDGNMQGTERSMERLQADGSWQLEVGSHKAKDYAPVFEQVLEGFTPSDFQRSMLLAQGQFDAMLHAKPEERAAILERLTDTGDYQRLGERAARMRGAWEGRLAKRKAHRDAIAPLSGEALAEAKATLQSETEGMKALDAEKARLQEALDWLRRQAALEVDQVAAREEVAAVVSKQEAAAGTLEGLAAHEACAEAFVALDRSAEADAQLAEHRKEQEKLAASLPGLAQAESKAGEALEGAKAAWAAALGALDGLREPANRATTARAQLAQARKEAQGAQEGLEGATRRHAEAQQGLAKAAEGVKAAGEALGQATEALHAQKGGEAVHQALPGLKEQGTALRERQEALGRDRAKDKARREQLRSAEAALAAARTAHKAAWEAEVAPKEATLRAAREALRSLVGAAEPDTLATELRKALATSQRGGEALLQVQVALTEAAERRQAHEARGVALVAADKAHAEASEGQAQAAQGLQVAREGVATAEAQLAPLRRIADLGAQRQALEEGEPCPLCGSGEHPFLHDPTQRAQAEAIEAEVAKAEAAVAAAGKARDEADAAHTRAVSAVAAAASKVEGAQAESQRAEEALDAARKRAKEASAAAGHPEGLSADALALEQAKLQAEQERLEERLEQLDAARRTERAALDALTTAQVAHKEEESRIAQEAARLSEGTEELARRGEAQAADAASLEEGKGQLQAALAAVGIEAEDHAQGLAQAEARAAAWATSHDAHAKAVVAHDKADAAHRAAAESLTQAEALRSEAAKALTERQGALDKAQAGAEAAQGDLARAWAVAVALDGPDALPRPALDRAPAELVAFQDDRVAALHEGHTAARRHRDTQRQALTQAQARQAALADAEGRLVATAAERHATLTEHLEARSLPDTTALVARRLSDEALATARELRERLHKAHTQAQARVQAATQQLHRHEQARPDSFPDDPEADAPTPDALEASLTALGEQRATVQERLDAARTTVDMAARDRDALAQAQAALEADQASASVWLHLHDLIGVGDGKRFKLFAQALNLDQLLVQANRHLEELNERYHLVSILDPETGLPSLDFEVTDRWRPGTTRSLKTLSGGESFLVSLALALGLSDLRTSSMPVETLLLDEGFGTLDPATLDTALAALQQLQASGRQVGLISHVVGLQERIEARVRVEPMGEGRSRVRVG